MAERRYVHGEPEQPEEEPQQEEPQEEEPEPQPEPQRQAGPGIREHVAALTSPMSDAEAGFLTLTLVAIAGLFVLNSDASAAFLAGVAKTIKDFGALARKQR